MFIIFPIPFFLIDSINRSFSENSNIGYQIIILDFINFSSMLSKILLTLSKSSFISYYGSIKIKEDSNLFDKLLI